MKQTQTTLRAKKMRNCALISQFYCEISIKYGKSQVNSYNTFKVSMRNHQCKWKITSFDFSPPKTRKQKLFHFSKASKINKTGLKISKCPNLKQ